MCKLFLKSKPGQASCLEFYEENGVCSSQTFPPHPRAAGGRPTRIWGAQPTSPRWTQGGIFPFLDRDERFWRAPASDRAAWRAPSLVCSSQRGPVVGPHSRGLQRPGWETSRDGSDEEPGDIWKGILKARRCQAAYPVS